MPLEPDSWLVAEYKKNVTTSGTLEFDMKWNKYGTNWDNGRLTK